MYRYCGRYNVAIALSTGHHCRHAGTVVVVGLEHIGHFKTISPTPDSQCSMQQLSPLLLVMLQYLGFVAKLNQGYIAQNGGLEGMEA